MVKIDNLETQTEANANQANRPSSHPLNNQAQTKPNNLITTIGQLLPLAPFVYEQFTGQKVPQLSGTISEIQTALQQLQLTHTQILNNQQQIYQQIENLKTNASQQFTNLTHQFQSLRLTHTQEKKQIEFNPPKLENPEY